MKNKEYTLKSLAYLVDGYLELRNNISNNKSEIPNKFIKGLSSLKLISIKEGENFPSSLDGFYPLISTPIGEWGYDFINKAIENLEINEYALYQTEFKDEEYDEDSFYFDDEEHDYEDIDVLAGAKNIKKAILMNTDASDINEIFNDKTFYKIRNSLDQEGYEIFRDDMTNNLLSTRDFGKVNCFKGLDDKIIDIIKNDMYTTVDRYTQVHTLNNSKPVIVKCPVCRALMEKDGRHHLKCPIPKCNTKKKLLGYSLHSYNDSDIIPYNNNLRVLKTYYHNSIKFPGIAESELLEALNKFNKKYGFISKIVKYPKKDSADFLIYLTNGDIHIIDVKDYTDSKDLAEYLDSSKLNDITKKNHGLKYTKAFIITPDYWSKKYRYRENFEENINNKKLNFHFVESYIKELESLTENQQLTLL